jgi:hypothetical protein
LTRWQYADGIEEPFGYWLEGAVGAVAYAAMGALIAIRVASNPLGRLMLGVGTAGAVQIFSGAMSSSAAQLGLASALEHLLSSVSAACQLLFVGGVVVLLQLAPTGRPLTRRWRYVVGLTTVGVGCATLDALLFTRTLESGGDLLGLGAVIHGALTGAGTLIMLGLAAAVVCLALRWYRARGLERQQVLWVALGGIGGPALVIVSGWFPDAALDALDGIESVLHGSLIWAMAGVALPAGIAIAVLRHKLYDIERVVSRTTSYVLVTGMLVLLYAVVVALVGWLLPVSESLPVAVGTLVAAAALRPALRRTRSVVDRRFNRSRYDAERIVGAFAGRLRDGIDPDVVVADCVDVVRRTVQPASIVLWIRPQ